MSTRPTLTRDGRHLLRAGHPHRVISGALHYFRIHPDLWQDRLERVIALGCNTVELYIPWNFHHPAPTAAPVFEAWRDVPAFIRLADALGLDVIVRPGPYICAEWDFGGLPAWLLADENLRIRTMDPAYLAAVDAWFDHLIPRLVPLLATNGGPIVAVQVENEYGSYGTDPAYLAHIRDGLTARGVDVLLVTSDGPQPRMLAGGTLPDVWATTNFGSRAAEAFAAFQELRPEEPLFCMEFWNGWFDHFGEQHHVRDPEDAAEALDGILAAGASVNIYMAHGGTNFGFWAGANQGGGHETAAGYQPTVTSYDYDAPIGEAGELTPKFHAFREVIGRYAPIPPADSLPQPRPRVSPRQVTARPVAALRDRISTLAPLSQRRSFPEPMEKLGHSFGLVHYRHRLTGPAGPATLLVEGVRDRAQVFADGTLVGVLERDTPDPRLEIRVPDGGTDLEILVEPYGRVNYGPRLIDRKGLIGGVRLDHQFLFGWDISVLPLDDLSSLPSVGDVPSVADVPSVGDAPSVRDVPLVGAIPATGGLPATGPTPDVAGAGPVFHRAPVDLPAPADAFLAVPGSTRSLVWLNGFLLGRLESRGPAATLYAPGPLWQAGPNDVVVLALDGAAPDGGLRIEVRDQPDLGPLAPPVTY